LPLKPGQSSYNWITERGVCVLHTGRLPRREGSKT